MKSYYAIEIEGIIHSAQHAEKWQQAKKLANLAIKQFPENIVTVYQRTQIQGQCRHQRIVGYSEFEPILEKELRRWQCIDSFFSHVKPPHDL